MIELGIAGADPRDLSWLLAVDLRAAGVEVSRVVGDLGQACGPETWDQADLWLFWPHQLTAQGWRDLEARCLSRRVPLLAACRDQEAALTALRHGVRCLTMPDDSAWSLKAALVAAVAGQPFLSPALLQQSFPCLVGMLTAEDAPVQAAPHCLTARELDVLRLLAAGSTNARIAGELFISPATVSTHVISILRKLGVANRTQASAAAHRLGLTTGADRLTA